MRERQVACCKSQVGCRLARQGEAAVPACTERIAAPAIAAAVADRTLKGCTDYFWHHQQFISLSAMRQVKLTRLLAFSGVTHKTRWQKSEMVRL